MQRDSVKALGLVCAAIALFLVATFALSQPSGAQQSDPESIHPLGITSTPTPTRTRTPIPPPTQPPPGAPRVLGFDVWCGRSEPGQKVELVTVVDDPDGIADLKLVYFVVNNYVSFADGVAMAYNLEVNKMVIRNDANTGWIVGGAPGTGGDLNTGRATLHVSESSAGDVDGHLVVRWMVTFKAPFAGKVRNLYVQAVDKGGKRSGWETIGAWGVGTEGYPPCVGAVNPPSGSSEAGAVAHFATQFSDPDGLSNLQIVYFLVSQLPSTKVASACVAYNADVGKVFLRNDADTGWLGGYAPGSAHTIENSRVVVDVADCTVISGGSTLVANWALRFKPAFTGWRYLYASARDDDNHYASWQKKGTWDIE